eukprot:363901-Chlamydomonas_euryale.AAC.22
MAATAATTVVHAEHGKLSRICGSLSPALVADCLPSNAYSNDQLLCAELELQHCALALPIWLQTSVA